MLRKIKIILCFGSSCFARGNQDLVSAIRSYLIRNQMEDKVDFKGDHCFGSCSEGPNMFIDNRLFNAVTVDNVDEMLEEGLEEAQRR